MTTTTKATTAVAVTTITIVKITAKTIATRTEDATTDDTTLATTSPKTKSIGDAVGERLTKNTLTPQTQMGTLVQVERSASREKYAKRECQRDSS